ncbi:MAG: VanW family protein [Candidatus Peribacteraceae bacterium]|nr:VanW family protein [Candidatus Peribacteraceae bacterium]MDP7454309.1 VanW family protein [Candidatus Peribacteraceae bacterium]MDP7645651.1 VanW family protein [Candidatus Peribacteraceae bacterium]
MTRRERHLSHATAICLSILTITVAIPDSSPSYSVYKASVSPEFAVEAKKRAPKVSQEKRMDLSSNFNAKIISSFNDRAVYPDTINYRIAKRLKKRLKKNKAPTPNIHTLAYAIDKRQKVLKNKIDVKFTSEENELDEVWDVSLQKYPLWLTSKFSLTEARYKVSPKRIAKQLETDPLLFLVFPNDITLTETSLSGSVLRAHTDGIAMPGYDLDIKKASKKIAKSLENGDEEVSFDLEWREGEVTYDNGDDDGKLTLLGAGRSNFTGSTWSRMRNVRKAIRQHVHNVVVQPGETYSFNETLNGPVNLGNGWSMAKVIYEGDQLRPAPGGGICQASTTTYRAIIDSGLPVVDRRSHSLYVYYYKKYGVGIDATIYPGTQDLTFENDTPGPILIQAYDTEDKDAFVKFYGIDDGREVALKGPYFKSNAPDDLKINDRVMYRNEIVWLYNVTYEDGTSKKNQIVSRYKTLPRSLPTEFVLKEEDDEIAQGTHTSAVD